MYSRLTRKRITLKYRIAYFFLQKTFTRRVTFPPLSADADKPAFSPLLIQHRKGEGGKEGGR